MKEWDALRRKIAELLQCDVELITDNENIPNHEGKWSKKDGEIWFPVDFPADGEAAALVLKGSNLRDDELKWIRLLIDQQTAFHRRQSNQTDSNEMAAFRDWVIHLSDGANELNPAPVLSMCLPLANEKLHLFLIVSDSTEMNASLTKEIELIIRTFFAAKLWIIPLYATEWLLIVPDSLWLENEIDETDVQSLYQALYEVLSSEIPGKFYIIADQPLLLGQLPISYKSMKNTYRIGKKYRPDQHVFVTDQLTLEKMIHGVADEIKLEFIESEKPLIHALKSAETRQMLHYYFRFNGHLSDTAKALYVHRNTLIYRLERFLQETGRDVRSFDDAVIVKMGTLLFQESPPFG